jgi:hypothetical protein
MHDLIEFDTQSPPPEIHLPPDLGDPTCYGFVYLVPAADSYVFAWRPANSAFMKKECLMYDSPSQFKDRCDDAIYQTFKDCLDSGAMIEEIMPDGYRQKGIWARLDGYRIEDGPGMNQLFYTDLYPLTKLQAKKLSAKQLVGQKSGRLKKRPNFSNWLNK